MGIRLNNDHVEKYRADGYLILDKPLFPPPRFDALKARFEMLIENWQQTMDKSPEHIVGPHLFDPKMFDWLMDDVILDLIEPLIGPDIGIFSSQFLCKPAGVGKVVPWHEDASYWRDKLQPVTVCTVWIAIDPSTRDNGCMRVIPGTHLNAGRQHHEVPDRSKSALSYGIDVQTINESKAVDCVLEENQCSLHDADLVHGSNANTSGRRRCGYNIRYFPTSVKVSESFQFKTYLARGKDRGGNQYGDPTKINNAWLETAPEYRKLCRLIR